jgi:hypothetical protein
MTLTLLCELINTTIIQENTAISNEEPTIIKIPYLTNLRTPSPGKYSRFRSLQTIPGLPPPGARVQNLPSVRTRCVHPIAPAPNTLDAVRVRVQGASIGCSGCRCCQRCLQPGDRFRMFLLKMLLRDEKAHHEPTSANRRTQDPHVSQAPRKSLFNSQLMNWISNGTNKHHISCGVHTRELLRQICR